MELISNKQSSDFEWISDILKNSNDQEEILKAKNLYYSYPHSGEKVDMFIKYFDLLKINDYNR